MKHHYQIGHQLYHNQIKVGRSPVEGSTDNILESYNSPSPISPTMSSNNLVTSASMSQINNVVTGPNTSGSGIMQHHHPQQQNHPHHDSEMVVFDDIGDTWSNRNLSSPIISDNEIRQMKQRYMKESYSMDDGTLAAVAQNSSAGTSSGKAGERDTKTQKVIGEWICLFVSLSVYLSSFVCHCLTPFACLLACPYLLQADTHTLSLFQISTRPVRVQVVVDDTVDWGE